MKGQEENDVLLFNSPVETGVRALVVLNAVYPRALDLSQLTWFDHLVVHTADIGGPASLHPDVPQRSGELFVRRRLIEESLILMRRLHLVSVLVEDLGITYQASDEAPAFVKFMKSKYARDLKERAQWLAQHICSLDAASIKDLITERIGRWNIEFQGEGYPEWRLLWTPAE